MLMLFRKQLYGDHMFHLVFLSGNVTPIARVFNWRFHGHSCLSCYTTHDSPIIEGGWNKSGGWNFTKINNQGWESSIGDY